MDFPKIGIYTWFKEPTIEEFGQDIKIILILSRGHINVRFDIRAECSFILL